MNFSFEHPTWQGNVTDINARPSASYMSNYQSIEFAPPADYTGNPEDIHSWIVLKGYGNKKDIHFGGIYPTGNGKILGQIGITNTALRFDAEGVARAGEGGSYTMIPFRSLTETRRTNYDAKFIYATYLAGNPFGFKLRMIRKTSTDPNGYLSFMRENNSIYTEHLTWGWANFSCSHIFGYTGVNADAFYQNDYSVMDGYHLDLQASYEFNGNHKSGLRVRIDNQTGDDYHWVYQEGSEFVGAYVMDPDWVSKDNMMFVRAYSKVKYWTFGNLDAGILYFGQYGRHNKFGKNRHNNDISDSREKEREYIIETNPFFNLKFEKGYLDFGMLIEGSFTQMRNVTTRWNDASNSEEENVLWNTTPYNGWSPDWENFSKGRYLFFATGGEIYSSMTLYKRLSLQAGVTLLRKFSFVRKVYGSSEVSQARAKYTFNTTHKRNDFKNETWMTGSIGFSYGRGPLQAIVSLQLPLAYLNKRQTKLKDEEELQFIHKKRDVWAVQQPTAFNILLVCALSKPAEH